LEAISRSRAWVREIRIREPRGAFRVIYQAVLEDVVLVLNAFQKKTQKTPQQKSRRLAIV
jgi:phage-related protein